MALTPRWTFLLTSRTGVPYGEILGASERQVIRALNAPSTAGFRLPIEAAGALAAPLLTSDTLLRCYRGGRLQFHGPVQSVELAASDPNAMPSFAVTAADPSIRFSKRFVGKSPSGTAATAAVDRITFIESQIAVANASGETGVQTLGRTSGSTISYPIPAYTRLNELIATISQTYSGFDWHINPIEYAAGKLGTFDAYGSFGSTKPNAVFEYQGRANMRAPVFQRNWGDVANTVYHLHPAGASVPGGVRSKTDGTSITDHGLYEDVIDSDLTLDANRDALLDEHILYRKNPRLVFAFQPDFDDYTGRVPTWQSDYFLGDQVRCAVRWEGTLLIDGYARLYKMQFDIDANDRESLTPTLVDEG